MGRRIEADELIEHFTLCPEEHELLGDKSGVGRLGFSLLLKYLLWKGRFPRGRSDLPAGSVEFVAKQVGVAACEIGFYDWDGRQVKRHRVQLRGILGFRECTVADADKVMVWLVEHVCQTERRAERVRERLLAHLRAERIEPPTPGQMGRVIGAALRAAEQTLTLRLSSCIPDAAVARMRALVAEASDDPAETEEPDGREVFAQLRTDPGNVSLKTCETETAKLAVIRAVGLPATLFADVSPKVMAAWRARVAMETPSLLREHPEPIKLTVLAAYLRCREREITDILVDLLIATVHRINARAETKVVGEVVAELKRVSGKENILFKMTEAALDTPRGPVSEVIYPAVPGGVATLEGLRREYQSRGSTFRQHKQRVFKASYTHHYRRGLIGLVEALEFGCTNTTHAPVMTALDLIKRYKKDTTHATQYYAHGEHVPVEGVIPLELAELMYRADKNNRRRVLRSVYECGVFQTLREKLRCKEIWVAGADRWRNPDEDLPTDFEDKRAENYAQLRKPVNPTTFTTELREEMRTELAALHDALPGLDWLEIKDGRTSGAIILTPLDAVPEPRNLRRLKAAVKARWGVVPLLDMLTETALRTGCLNAFTPAGTRGDVDPAVLFERLLLLIHAAGTNIGVRAVAAGNHPHSEEELRYTRRRYFTVDACREVARAIANATFAARHGWLWGEGTTAVASDSTHYSAFDQNIFTEYHSRYKRAKRGVLIYWTVETAGAMAIYSQLLSCSASEVHAMVEGAMRHGTEMRLESNAVDSHGASYIGFGITRLLGFDLIARFKQINKMKLYLPGRGQTDTYPRLAPALTRPIRWDLIEPNYDSMVKYATAIRLGTASTEAILRRFTKDVTHPAYAAMLEVGRAQRTIFLARWLRDRDLQRETNSGLNVVENYNGVGDYIHFGKRGELASNRREEQELSILCLQILQSSLGFINTLMIQDLMAEPEWVDSLGEADQRGLTPLFTVNMTPYGEVLLRPERRLDLRATTPPAQPEAAQDTDRPGGQE
ncbi:MAG: Tn3 family transposase [Pseudonocardiaceae bacterium]